jgi:WD40 repeat protein
VLACCADPKGELVFFIGDETKPYRLDSLVRALTMTPDGRYLIIGAGNGTILVRDRHSFGATPVRRTHRGPVRALATSPDGEYAASGGDDGSVQIWRIGSEGLVIRLDLSKSPIRAVAVARDAKQIVAADSDGVVYLGDPFAATPDPRPSADAVPPDPLVTAFMVLDVRNAVVGWDNGMVRIFDPRDPELREDQLHTLGEGRIQHIAPAVIAGESAVFVSTQDSRRLFTSTGWLDVTRWPAAGMLTSAPTTSGHIVIVDRLMAVSATAEGRIGIADAGDGGYHVTDLGEHPGCRVVLCAHVNGRPTAFTGGDDGAVRIWDLLDRGLTDTIEIGRPVWRIEVVDGNLLLVGAGGELIAFEHVSVVRR